MLLPSINSTFSLFQSIFYPWLHIKQQFSRAIYLQFCRQFLGDIVLDAEQAREIYENAIQHGYRVKRKFIGSELRRWNPRQPIIYSFDGSHSKQMLFAKENKND